MERRISKKYYIITLLLVLISTLAQAQQAAFQGTWIGERSPVDRSAYRIVISGTSWQEFYNNQIEAAGTVRFSTGRAELLLADGRLAWDLRLLAPGLIEQPISMWAGLYRFRLNQAPAPQSEFPERSSHNNQNRFILVTIPTARIFPNFGSTSRGNSYVNMHYMRLGELEQLLGRSLVFLKSNAIWGENHGNHDFMLNNYPDINSFTIFNFQQYSDIKESTLGYMTYYYNLNQLNINDKEDFLLYTVSIFNLEYGVNAQITEDNRYYWPNIPYWGVSVQLINDSENDYLEVFVNLQSGR